MSPSVRLHHSLHTELAAVMDALVRAAVAELRRVSQQEDTDSLLLHTLAQFESGMETLGNQALEKIFSILDTVAAELKLDILTYPTPEPNVLYVLEDSNIWVEHSYSAVDHRNRSEPVTQKHCYATNDKTPEENLFTLDHDQSDEDSFAKTSHSKGKCGPSSQNTVEKERGSLKKTKFWKDLSKQPEKYQRDKNLGENLNGGQPKEVPVHPVFLITTIRCEESNIETPCSPDFSLKTNEFICTNCGSSYSDEKALRVHMLSHPREKSFKCPTCDLSFMKAHSLKLHMYKHTGDYPYKCTECEKGFSDAYKLQGHLIVHTGQKPFTCEVCGKSYTDKTNLYRHMRSHSATKPYLCSECGRGFTRAKGLKNHMSVHSGERPCKCTHCDRSFNDKFQLIVHERTHTGERPYLCPLCGKSFRTKMALCVHERIHTGEKPYVCNICGRGFSQQSSLNTHKRVHSGCSLNTHRIIERNFICHICTKAFKTSWELKLHLRIHSGERPYYCKLCDKRFVQTAHLRSHMIHMHSGIKQCMCERCGKTYALKQSLKVHKCPFK